jgi:hypothetical protein
LRHPLSLELDQQCRPLAGKIRQVERGSDAPISRPAISFQAALMSTVGAIFQKNVGLR